MTALLHLSQVALGLICGLLPQPSYAAVLYESAALGETGVLPSQGHSGEVPGLNVGGGGIRGARFYLEHVSLVTGVGGHFVRNWESPENDRLFGAIVSLSGPRDYPDSENLSTDDVLADTYIKLPATSADVRGPMNLLLQPGWYAIVFGSYYDGEYLFGAGGLGAMPRNNADVGDPSYIFASRNTPGWAELYSNFRDVRYVVRGFVIPEPSAAVLMALASVGVCQQARSRCG